ncbi:hypothetical protein M8C21_006051 [Ambrosia artemisiifolia]|uniref:F-box domain-containing protein n=1 Tax=Ambrosia artemisiifolia TaxID=4212 RepID=A0AAD5GWL4_AMBAR|nr:hypothetical protein M8C21_006051 [Ambrosia artemisiifolia]
MARKASNFATKDFISNMPDNVVTHILDRLPVQDAVKTSSLSKNWRLKWTMLTQLVFDDNFVDYLTKTDGESKFGRIISRIFLNLKSAITKFVLYIDERNNSALDDEDIVHWIMLLSKKGVEDLTIMKTFGEPLTLPFHLFSCLELKHLKLFYCFFDPPASFHGFPRLLSLEGVLDFESSKFGEFITQCPLLEILNIDIFELVGFLPKLQELNLDFASCKLTKDVAKTKFPATFPCLKTLELSTIDVYKGGLLSFALELIGSSPNLQTLEISANELNYDPTRAKLSPDVDYSTTGLLQLRSVVVLGFKDSVIEVCLIESLLACSPFLKTFVVRPHSHLSSNEQLRFARKLLKLHRASLVVEIDLL